MKIFNTILITTFLLVILSSDLIAQRGDRIEAMRVAFITQKLALTPSESEKFWPVYNLYRNAIIDLRRQTSIETNLEAMSDADAEKAIQISIERMEKELSLFKKLAGDLKTILPARKIAILTKTERSFNEELIRRSQLKEEVRPFKRN